MDWLLATPQINSVFSSLGSLEGETYVVSGNALAILEEIYYKLTYEDQTLRTFRRAIGFGQNVRSDLIPVLENTKDDAVLDSVIRILVNLTVPVECLFSVDVMYRTEVGRHTIFELNRLLYTSKEAFVDAKSTKSVVEYMKHILESDSKLSLQKCDQINNCLLLLRNILHIPENNSNFIIPQTHNTASNPHGTISMQNSILWNLFIQSIDKLLLYLMTCPQRAVWGVTMVQLIALMYKDQHVSSLQKLLNLWFEASLSESSEDNESNTSPPKQGSGDSSPMLTSDPTSDSSDNGIGSKNESSEDRRQALREETEATLQEVSRKGHEYQNFMLGVPMGDDKSDNASAMDDFEQPCTSAQALAAAETAVVAASAAEVATNIEFPSSLKTEPMDCVDEGEQSPPQDDEEEEEDSSSADENVFDSVDENSPEVKIPSKDNENNNKNNTKQPAEHSTDTTTPDRKSISGETRSDDDDSKNFMPPPATPIKFATSAQVASLKPSLPDSLPMPYKKVPHSGQLGIMTMGKCCPQKRECPSSQSELSDCGYGTQVENQESVSTSSNDDDAPQGKPQHQKPPCSSKPRNKQRIVLTTVDKKELRRKKLVKRSKSSLINMKGLVQHTPTDEDISNLLKEFTVDFLLKGYGFLVEELHNQLLSNMRVIIDTSHFFWLVTYFLKFAAQLELDMEHINSILTFDVISYLTYEGVNLCEQLELNCRQEGSDLKPYLRRLHLVVTAIREFLQAIETYKKVTHLSEEDRSHLQRLQVQISSSEDLRCLFVLLLRRFNPSLQTKQYLQDLVVTNHILLLILDGVTKSDANSNIKMMDHISHFATLEIMHYYGLLLEDFSNNGEFVNDCIFTMMHHVGGDLEQMGALFQPVVLKTFSRIWETDYELCDDWSDIIEYVIHKFMNTPQKNQLALPTTSLTELTKEHNLENPVCSWTQEEKDTLYWYYVQSKKDNDIVGKILNLFSNNGNKQKSRISIIQQLLQQDIITLVEYDDLMKFEDAEYQRTLLMTPTTCTTESGIDMKTSSTFSKPADDIQILRDLIVKEGKEKLLTWLQKILLECCYIKLTLKKFPLRQDHQNLKDIMEPVAYHAIMKNKSIPVVQWNNEQQSSMLYQPFVLLLHKLGFQLPADAGSIFARIPDYWTPETMYNLTKKLGSLDQLSIKFDHLQMEASSAAAASTNCHHIMTARGSLSSMSSLETDITETDELNSGPSSAGIGSSTLTPIAEIDARMERDETNSNEIFAIPKAKQSNSIIRYTPNPASIPTVPNWLQLVMRSKVNATLSETSTSQTTQITTNTLLATTSSQALNNDDERDDIDVFMSSNKEQQHDLVVDVESTTFANEVTKISKQQQSLLTTAMLPPTIMTATTTITATGKSFIKLNSGTSDNNQSHNNIETTTSTDIAETENKTVTKSKLTATTNGTSNNKNNSNSNINVSNSLFFKEHQTEIIKQSQMQQQQQHLLVQQHHGPPHYSLQTPQHSGNLQQQTYHQHYMSDEDSSMKCLDRNDMISCNSQARSTANAGLTTSNLESEYSAMVASFYENEIANSDTASVASDLTRMYVSDEDERHDVRINHYH